MAQRRAEQKQRTRARILAAARKLFASPGYEETTIRMIAHEASVAPGSVFTTFDSKEDVLLAIATEKYDELADHLAARLHGAEGTARQRLKHAFACAYAFEHDRLALLMKQLGASWTWSHDMEARSQERLARPFGFVATLCREARATGEICERTDLDVLADVLLGLYLRNFRHAWFRQLDPGATATLAARQIDLIFDGACGRTPDSADSRSPDTFLR
ncbi:MAG: TetR/AcrR family transcriptional regulator [Hyphomonadaceae bacterium]|nr:TetR/AcrR family transcriptional regulator [Hyphomonadaceae bacterium]